MVSPERVVEKKKRSLFSNDFLIEIGGVPHGVKVGEKPSPISNPIQRAGDGVIEASSIGWNIALIELDLHFVL
jgi:hypothetical protein